MFEEAQLYSPVTQREDGKVEVHLGQDHPGFNDPEYRKRRNEIAAAAMAWTPGEPIPHVDYTEAEHEIWRVVCRELHDKHEKYACRDYLEGKARLALPEDRVPQLSEVTAGLRPLTGFEYHCAPGLVPLREFYGALADRVFHSTQYVRHPSEPLYTPEPDIIHEVIGHGNMLASPRFAEVKRLAGDAARRVETDEALQVIADVFWFTLEFGVIREGGELKAYGAGILSSYGEIEEFRHTEIRPIDLAEMSAIEYDITKYQPILYAAESMDHLEDVVGGFFATADDDTPARLARGLAPPSDGAQRRAALTTSARGCSRRAPRASARRSGRACRGGRGRSRLPTAARQAASMSTGPRPRRAGRPWGSAGRPRGPRRGAPSAAASSRLSAGPPAARDRASASRAR